MSHHIVEAKGVHYQYPDGTKALDGVDFLITHGESVAVIGANGAGKSTLLMHLIGSYLPNKGAFRIGDLPLTKKTIPAIRRSVGMVFQDPDDQLFMPTVFEDIAFGPLNLGLPTEEVEKRVQDALETIGCTHLKERPPYKLSGGEKRSVAIATVLAMMPDILVMDEPSSNLDPQSRTRLINQLKSFKHTKIIATHDLDMVLDLCERTIVLRKGRIVADRPTVEIMRDDLLLLESNLEKPLRMQHCPVCGNESESDKSK